MSTTAPPEPWPDADVAGDPDDHTAWWEDWTETNVVWPDDVTVETHKVFLDTVAELADPTDAETLDRAQVVDAVLRQHLDHARHAGSLSSVGDRLLQARAEHQVATAAAQHAARLADADGIPQTRIAEQLGVNRITIGRWTGRRA